MKNLTEMGIDIIKCENNNGTDAIKTIHYQVNNIIMKNKYRKQSFRSANRIYMELADLGVKLSKLEVPQSARAKKDEILKKLRKYVMAVRDYVKMGNREEYNDPREIQKIVNYMVGSYLNQKDDKYDNVESILEYLQDMKNVGDDYNFDGVNTTKFKQLNEEILNDLMERYKVK